MHNNPAAYQCDCGFVTGGLYLCHVEEDGDSMFYPEHCPRCGGRIISVERRKSFGHVYGNGIEFNLWKMHVEDADGGEPS